MSRFDNLRDAAIEPIRQAFADLSSDDYRELLRQVKVEVDNRIETEANAEKLGEKT